MKRGLIAGLLAVMLASSLVAAPAAASPDLNFENENTPNPALTEDTLTIGQYNMSAMDSPLEYYDDSGNVQELNATYNTSQDTPFSYRADQVNADVYSEFPRESANASAIDHTEWTTSSGASSSVSVNDADGNTAQGVPAVEIAATVADTETATATYDNFSAITTDANKRVLRFVGNVDSLASGAQVEVRAVDSDGDYKAATVNASESASADGVIGTGTGDGYVFQQRLSDLSTVGNGDGTFDDIAKIEVVTSDADATVTIVGLDAESKSAMTLGETVNSDGDEVVVEERNAGGDMSLEVIGLDTLGSEFDEATVNDFEVSDVRYPLSEVVAEDDYSVEFSDATDYAYDRKLELNARLDIPAAIDLTHSGLAFEMDQTFVSQRYATVEMAEGVGSTEFSNISSWEDKTDLFSSEGSTVTLDDTVAVDKQYAVSATILLQQGEEDAMKSSGPVGGPVGSGSGGLIGSIFAFFDSLVGKVVGVVGLFAGGVKGFGKMMGS